MRVRRVEATEWERLRELRLRSLAEAPYAFRSNLERESEFPDEQWKEWARAGARGEDSICLVAETETGELCATAVGLLREGEDNLVGMWVAPELRRRGIGRTLVEHVAEWARSRGLTSMVFWVIETNAEAIRFYQRLGFVLTGERRQEAGGFELRMARRL